MPEKDTPTHPWLMERRYFPLIIVLVFVILSATAFNICYRHHTINTEQTLKEDRSTANLLSLLLDEHLKKIVGVMESYGNRPALLQAVRDKNAEQARERLIRLIKSNPDIDSVIITDRQGTLWAAYPERPEVLGKNFAYRDWYKDVSKEWKSNISDVIQRVVGEKDLAVQISVPFFDEKGEAIGILVNTQRTVVLSNLFKQVPLDPSQSITVTDRKGQIVYSSRHDVEKEIRSYPFYSGIKKAMAAKNITFAVDDPDLGGRTRYISFAPATNIGWTVSIERDKRSILLSESAYYIQVTAIACLLFLSIILFLFYSRKQVTVQQIREQLEVEKKLRAGEERFKSYIDVTMQLAWTTNAQGEIVEDDPSWSKYTGRGYEAYKGFGWIEDIHPDDRDHTEKIWTKAVAEKSFYETEYRVRRYDGVYRDYLARGIPLLDENGSIREWIGTCIDITDRKLAEDALRVSEEKFAKAFQSSPDAFLLTSVPDGRITEVNTVATLITGYSKEEMLGRTTTELGLWADPAARDAYMAEILREGRAANFETVFRVKSGAIINGLISGGIIQLQDGKCFLSVVRDITELKQVEKQIHRQSKLLAAINSVFYETLTADSEEMVASTCLKVAQETTGSKFGFIGEITPEGLFTTTALSDPGWEACRMPETLSNVLIKDMVIRGIWGQVILKEQSLIVNDPVSCPDRVGIPEGHPPLTSFLGIPLKDQGKVIGMIAMANRESGYTADQKHDMEALCVAFVEAIRRKRAEIKINQLNIELEQRVLDRTAQLDIVNKELEAFSYSVSHDLRAPLRSIDGFSQALLEEYANKLDDTGKIYLERVRKATQNMGFLIDDMLKLSRVTQAEFKHEAIDLSVMVRAIAEELQKNNPDRSVDMTVQDGIIVQGDPYIMKIVIENLMGNAWKFTGNVRYPRIEFGTTARDGKTICFIRDNGAGFDMAYVNKLFGAFQRLHTTHEFPGTGIGLATVRRIISRHGGQVWAEGEVGKGATFYFILPS
jgi:PAS domain S-box-containing protein